MQRQGKLKLPETLAVSRIWRVMVERISQAWTTIPHFYLLREANATHLIDWLREARERSSEKITYSDLLVKADGGGAAAASAPERIVAEQHDCAQPGDQHWLGGRG